MAPKKATGTTTAAKKAAPAEHPPYKDMIKEAILQLKERNGSSRQAIKKYVLNNNKGIKTTNFDKLFNAALKRGVTAGDFVQPKGPSGPVKLQKKDQKKEVAKPAKSEKAPTKTAPKKAAPKKATTTTKPAAAKPKPTVKAVKSSTANSKKPRKSATAEKPAIKKTKTGRVTKTTTTTATAKKAAPKKAATKKKADAAPAAASE